MSKQMKALTLTLVLVFVTGCTSTRLSEENRQSIETIELPNASEIVFKKEPRLFTQGQGFAMGLGAGIGGALGAVIAGSINTKKTGPELIKEYLFSEPKPYSSTIVEILANHISNESNFKLSHDGVADAKITLTVGDYGLSYVPFTKSYRPYATLTGEIIDETGKSIWKYQGSLTSHSDITEKHRKNEFFESPELMRKSFLDISGFILRNMALHLSGKQVIPSVDIEDSEEE